MLGAVPRHITDPAPQEYPGADADGLIVGVVEQWGELPRGGVVGISQVWLQHPHIGVNGAIGEVHPHIIVLVGIPDVEQYRLIHVFYVDPGFDSLPWVAICAIGSYRQPHIPACHQLLDDMPSPIIEGAGVNPVPGVIVGEGSGAEEDVHGRDPGISRDIIEVGSAAADFYPWFGVAQVEVGARGAHGAKGSRGHHIYLPSSLLYTLLLDEVDHLLGGHHHSLSPANPVIYFSDGLCQLFHLHRFLSLYP